MLVMNQGQGGLPQGPVEAELGPVVVGHGGVVVAVGLGQGLDRGHHLLGTDHQHEHVAAQALRLAQALQVLRGRLDRVPGTPI